MRELAIKISLDEETRKQGVLICGTVYSLHITNGGEVIITDNEDYTKIYAVHSLDFFNMICADGGGA